MKPCYMIEARGLKFPSYHFLFENFDRKLQQYIEGDLVNYNVRLWKQRNDPNTMKVDEEPFAVLTLAELEAAFVVSMAPLGVSIVLFIFEWIPTIKDFLVFLIIFKKYFDLKKNRAGSTF